MSSTIKALALVALAATPIAAYAMEASEDATPTTEPGWLETLLPTLTLIHGAG